MNDVVTLAGAMQPINYTAILPPYEFINEIQFYRI